MKNSFFCAVSITSILLTSCKERNPPQYMFYNPYIEVQQISFPDSGCQHHDQTITWFQYRWIAQYDDHVVPRGVPQYIHQINSFDFKNWTSPIRVYSDSAGSVNPMPYYDEQWQPCFVKVKNELWSIWSVTGLKEVYFSRLYEPGGKWQNEIIPMQNLFISNGGLVLSNGWVAVPVTKIPSISEKGRSTKVLPEDGEVNSDHFIYTADHGKTWQLSTGTRAHRGSTWEATIWEPRRGEVWMIARNIGTEEKVQRTPMTEAAGYNYSLDFGKTWAHDKRQVIPMELSNSRPHAVNFGERNIMAHNDYYTPSLLHWEHRYNIALYFNRGRGVNFVAGPVIDTMMSEYPQIFIHEDQAIVIYSAREHYPATAPKSSKELKDRYVKVARLELPGPDKYYIFARTARGKVDEVDKDGRKALRFHDNYSSAGIDADENNSRKDEVYISFKFKVESQGEQALFTIGYPPVQLVAKGNEVSLNSEKESFRIGYCKKWTEVELVSKPDEISARLSNGKWVTIKHTLDEAGRWLYFGQGYYKTNNGTEVREPQNGKKFLIDIGSIRTNVKAVAVN